MNTISQVESSWLQKLHYIPMFRQWTIPKTLQNIWWVLYSFSFIWSDNKLYRFKQIQVGRTYDDPEEYEFREQMFLKRKHFVKVTNDVVPKQPKLYSVALTALSEFSVDEVLQKLGGYKKFVPTGNSTMLSWVVFFLFFLWSGRLREVHVCCDISGNSLDVHYYKDLKVTLTIVLALFFLHTFFYMYEEQRLQNPN